MALTQYLLQQLYILDWRPYRPIECVYIKEFLKGASGLMSNQPDTDCDADLRQLKVRSVCCTLLLVSSYFHQAQSLYSDLHFLPSVAMHTLILRYPCRNYALFNLGCSGPGLKSDDVMTLSSDTRFSDLEHSFNRQLNHPNRSTGFKVETMLPVEEILITALKEHDYRDSKFHIS